MPEIAPWKTSYIEKQHLGAAVVEFYNGLHTAVEAMKTSEDPLPTDVLTGISTIEFELQKLHKKLVVY